MTVTEKLAHAAERKAFETMLDSLIRKSRTQDVGKVADDLRVHDHEGIVWDEMVGMWITLWLVPEGWWWLLIGFVVFRIVDILKPWPISWVDRNVHGGVGIMLDDVLAGVFAWLVMQGLVWGWVHWLV